MRLLSISITSLDLMTFFSIINLPRIKDRAYVSKSKRWDSLFIDRNTAVYFDSFGIEYIPQEVLNKIKDKSITHNIFRIQDIESIMCGFFCIAFIEYLFAGKTFFSLNDSKKNDKTIYKSFKDRYGRRSKSRV